MVERNSFQIETLRRRIQELAKQKYEGGTNMQSDITGILPTPEHICVVVKDIDKTTEFLSSIWDFGSWLTWEYSPKRDEIIIGEPFTIKGAWANLGPIVLELIQPIEGKSIWSQFLETRGEGLHHICFIVSNWDEMVSKLKQQGAKMVAGGIFLGKHWSYFEVNPGGLIVEISEQSIHDELHRKLG
jgi:methylmalonyl-CoA/ethylmalonyl-CoA epimerase